MKVNYKTKLMSTKNYLKKVAIAAAGLFASVSYANNLKITGSSVDTAAGTVTFKIQWDNSWKTNIAPANHDAVWVFVKYQDCADKLWKHADLSNSAADHTAAGLLKIDAVNDGKGVFVYRNANGGGNISSTSITLKMNVAAANYENYNFKVFGVEMVNIPQGNFWIGDGSSTSAFTQYEVTGNGAIGSGSIGSGNTAPALFPKGYSSFYSMKYEITQEQYVEFLNTLTYGQQARRTITNPNSAAGTSAFNISYRNGVKIKVPGNNASIPAVYGCDLINGDFDDLNDGQNLPMNYLNWNDFSAYLDWAALRPMTEIEFEKICRGPLAPVAGEYAWGTTEITGFATIENAGQPTEGVAAVANGRANFGVNSGIGNPTLYQAPVRVGYAATNSTGRLSSGASYYGAMEMSGNLGEFTVAAKTVGSTYTGKLGDGELSTTAATDGDANVESWPDSAGIIVKGGHFYVVGNGQSNTLRLRTSDRSEPAPGNTRGLAYGGRGVR